MKEGRCCTPDTICGLPAAALSCAGLDAHVFLSYFDVFVLRPLSSSSVPFHCPFLLPRFGGFYFILLPACTCACLPHSLFPSHPTTLLSRRCIS